MQHDPTQTAIEQERCSSVLGGREALDHACDLPRGHNGSHSWSDWHQEQIARHEHARRYQMALNPPSFRLADYQDFLADRLVQAQAAALGAGEQTFDRLNPEFGVPADTRDPAGHEAAQEREAGLALGMRVAVAEARENDASPVLEIVGQDYQAADAVREARWPTPAVSWAATPEAEQERGWSR